MEFLRTTGWVVFDAVTEPCLDTKTVEVWANAAIDNGSHPALLPRSVALNYFKEKGFSCLASFIVPMSPGTCETFVFRKGSLDQFHHLPTPELNHYKVKNPSAGFRFRSKSKTLVRFIKPVWQLQ
jgi:hypothetical protein